MGKLISRLFIFLVLVLSNLSITLDGKVISKEILANVDRKLKLLNKPAVKSIQSEDGDIIDCVDINKQPAFDHPALRNHIIQMRPSFDLAKESLRTKTKSSKPVVFQTWQRSGSCPEGTVPIRRIRRRDLLRATSLEHFGRKTPQVFSASNSTDQKDSRFVNANNTKIELLSIVNRSAALLVTTVGNNYTGAKADINVWNPNVEESPGEFTTAQIWLKGGPGDNFESVESGWVVNQDLYGDKLTRFFAYWTTDAYKTTGCFDLTCSGFVQTGSQVALGAAIDKISTESGQQYIITIGIYLDTNTNNWWLKYGADIAIGYWPAGSLMSYLKQSSTLVEWGGEVYSPNVKKNPHTKTAMGSGTFAVDSTSSLYGKACYMDNVRIMDYSLALKYPESVATWADEYYCYSTYSYEKKGAYPVFFFGGPGQNSLCP